METVMMSDRTSDQSCLTQYPQSKRNGSHFRLLLQRCLCPVFLGDWSYWTGLCFVSTHKSWESTELCGVLSSVNLTWTKSLLGLKTVHGLEKEKRLWPMVEYFLHNDLSLGEDCPVPCFALEKTGAGIVLPSCLLQCGADVTADLSSMSLLFIALCPDGGSGSSARKGQPNPDRGMCLEQGLKAPRDFVSKVVACSFESSVISSTLMVHVNEYL